MSANAEGESEPMTDPIDLGAETAYSKTVQDAACGYALNASPVIFYVATVSNVLRVTYVSPNVETLTGHEAARILAEPNYARDRVHPDDLDEEYQRKRQERA